MTDHDDELSVARAFDSLRADVASRIHGLPVLDIVARARRRRVRRVLAAGVLPACALAAGLGIWVSRATPSGAPVFPVAPTPGFASSSPSTTTTQVPFESLPPHGSATPSLRHGSGSSETVGLPAGYLFNGLTTQGGGLQLVGTDGSGKLCATAAVTRSTLRVGAVREFNCPNADASLAKASAVVTYSKTGSDATLAIALVNAAGEATVTGPPVMTFTPGSDTDPVFAYGGDSLWIYDVATTLGPRVLQVSAITGQVDGSIATPLLYRPILAADADGLWLGNSIDGAGGPTLLHIKSGVHAVSSVLADAQSVVDWLDDDGTNLWAGIRQRGGIDETLWRFDSVTAHAISHIAEPGLLASSVVGGEKSGLWTALPYPSVANGASPGTNGELDVIRIDPSTGQRVLEAVLPALDQNDAEQGIHPGSAAYADGAYYLLLPPFRQGGYLGYNTLVRVAQ